MPVSPIGITSNGCWARCATSTGGGIAFRWKDYRANGKLRWKTTTLAPAEFIRRFLIHVLPKSFHRIRHYGLFANGNRKDMIARAHQLLGVAMVAKPKDPDPSTTIGPGDPEQRGMALRPCPCCGGRMLIIEVFARGETPRHRPSPRAPPRKGEPP